MQRACPAVRLFVCLSVAKLQKRDFLKKLSNLWSLFTTYGKSYMGFSKNPLLSWSQSHVSHCRVLPPGEFNGISSQSDVSHCRVLALGEFTVMIPEPHATLQIVFRHILFLFFCFSMQFGLWRVTAFVSSPIHLFVLGFLTRIFAVIGAGAVVFCAPIFNRFKPNFISSILFVYFPLCFIFNASVDNSFSILILFRFWLILIFCGILTENWVEK